MDKYPSDLLAEIRQLKARVETLESQIRQRDGLTSASKGWVIGDMSDPSTPSSGGHLYSSGGEPYWKDSSGSVSALITPPITPGPAPNWPEPFDSPATIGSTPTATNYNQLRADAAGLHDDLRSVILSGVAAGVWPDPR